MKPRSIRSIIRSPGSPPGATTGSTTWSRTAPTGVSRGNARGGCPFRPSTAPPAAKRSRHPRSWRGRRRSSSRTAPMPGTNGQRRISSIRLDLKVVGGTSFEKEMNILAVWFDSDRVTRRCFRCDRSDWPAKQYLEGSDHDRGWFQSSALRRSRHERAAPFSEVLTPWLPDRSRRREKCRSRSAIRRGRAGGQTKRRRHPPVGVSMGDTRRDPRQQRDPGACREAYRKFANAALLVSNLSDSTARATPFSRILEKSTATSWRATRCRAPCLRGYERLRLRHDIPDLNAFVTVDLRRVLRRCREG